MFANAYENPKGGELNFFMIENKLRTIIYQILVDSPARSSFTVDSVNKSISMLEAIAEDNVSSTCTRSSSARLYSAADYTSKYLDDMDNQGTSLYELLFKGI